MSVQDTSRFPDRIYVKNETGNPGDSDIFDADTGKRFEGVYEVTVKKHEAVVEATEHWPITNGDLLVNDDSYHGNQQDGVKTLKRVYPIKRLELESW